VQPPEVIPAGYQARPFLDPSRAGSSSEFTTSLGGGARVRLCNPCVPDPNIAPPQTPELINSRHSSSHSRSVSLATNSTGRSEQSQQGSIRPSLDINNFQRHPREPSILGTHRASTSSSLQPTSSIATHNSSVQGSGYGHRSRSSTVCLSPPLPKSRANKK